MRKGVNMNTAGYSIEYRHSNGNVHGEFNHNTADAVLEILHTAYKGSGRIFIDTAKIQHIVESGAEYFKTACAVRGVPITCLFFKGEKGKHLGPNGSKVLLMKEREKKCCGNCKNCACKNHKANSAEKRTCCAE
jgi:hypothetical protein